MRNEGTEIKMDKITWWEKRKEWQRKKNYSEKKGDDRREILRKISRNVDCGMIDVKRIHRENTMNLKCKWISR